MWAWRSYAQCAPTAHYRLPIFTRLQEFIFPPYVLEPPGVYSRFSLRSIAPGAGTMRRALRNTGFTPIAYFMVYFVFRISLVKPPIRSTLYAVRPQLPHPHQPLSSSRWLLLLNL